MKDETLASCTLQRWYRRINANKQNKLRADVFEVLYEIPHRGQKLRVVRSSAALLKNNAHLISKVWLEMRKPRNMLSYYGYKPSMYRNHGAGDLTELVRYSLGLNDLPDNSQHYFIINESLRVLGLFEYCRSYEYVQEKVCPLKAGEALPSAHDLYPEGVRFFGIYIFEDSRKQSIAQSILTFLSKRGEPIHSLVSVENKVSQALHRKAGFLPAAVVEGDDSDDEDCYVFRPQKKPS